MGRAIETIGYQLTAAGASLVNMPVISGDSAQIRNSSKDVKLLSIWGSPQVSGGLRISSPLLHDTTNGLSFQHGSSNDIYLPPSRFQQPLQPQDTLNVSWSGSGVAGDIEQAFMTLYYSDLPGVDGKFITSEELNRRTVNLLSTRLTLTMGATGGYSGSEPINAESDTFKANTDYAIVGVASAVASAVGLVGFKSPDWGNLRIGVPVVGEPNFYNNYFARLSDELGLPTIPVFNSSNRGTTLVDAAGNENATSYSLSILYAELSGRR